MLDSAQSPNAPPQQVGRFRLLRKIGEGSMGAVYEGEDNRSGERVAVKLHTFDPAEDRDAASRVRREAGALEKISHPNVAALLDFGELTGGQPYLVFELIEGPSLQEIIELRSQIDYLDGVRWMTQAADALHEAWKHHIIHRDLKPSNMMIDRNGELKLVDFGLAKALHQDSGITAEKMLLGTPRYMSPEAGLGQSLDFRSDMYSLGATFYHLFVGQAPFEAPTHVAMMMKHVSSPLPPPRSVEPSLPHDIASVLSTLLAKDPRQRYPTYHDLIADLREVRMALLARSRATQTQQPPPAMGDPSVLDPRHERYAETNSRKHAVSSERSTGPLDAKERATRALEIPVEEKQLGHETRARLLAALGVVVLLMGIAIALNQRTGSSQTANPGHMGRVMQFVQALPLLKPATNPKREADRQVEETRQRMESLMSSLMRYEMEHGEMPQRLEDLSSARGSDDNDSWGHSFRYHRLTRTLRSPGPDGALGTSDDLMINGKMEFAEGAGDYSASP